VLEAIHNEQQRLVVVDLEVLIDDPLQLNGITLHFWRVDGMGNLAVGAKQSTPIDLQALWVAHEAELHREPKESRQRFEDAGNPLYFLLLRQIGHNFRRRVRAIPKAHQRIGKRSVRVHGYMPGDVMEDVRFRQIVQRVDVPDGDGGGKLTIAQAVKEQKSRHIATDRFGLEARKRAEEAVDLFQSRNVGLI